MRGGTGKRLQKSMCNHHLITSTITEFSKTPLTMGLMATAALACLVLGMTSKV